MSDLISRERLINEWDDLGRRYAMPTTPIHKRAFREFPSADVRENKGDLISRKAVLDELEKWDWQELYLPIHFKQILDDVPSVENKGEWIPVSERLPDNNVRVLCSAISTSISGGYTRFVGCCNNGYWFVQTDAETVSYPRQYKVTAWMPLPEPYKAERGE